MMKYEVYQNEKDDLWQWRIVDDQGEEIARSRKAYKHIGICHVEIIRVSRLDPVKDVVHVQGGSDD